MVARQYLAPPHPGLLVVRPTCALEPERDGSQIVKTGEPALIQEAGGAYEALAASFKSSPIWGGQVQERPTGDLVRPGRKASGKPHF